VWVVHPSSIIKTLLSVIYTIGTLGTVMVVFVVEEVEVDVDVEVPVVIVVLTATTCWVTVTNSSEIDTIKVSLVGTLYLIEYFITDPVTLFSPINKN